DTLQEYQNGLLNEMWIDYRPFQQEIAPRGGDPAPGQNFLPTLVLRERQFPTFEGGRRNWEALPTWDLGVADERNLSFVKGNPAERFNYWMIEGQGLGGDRYETIAYIQESAARSRGEPGSVPIYNLDSIRRHGFRKWQMATRFLPFAEQ